MAQRAADGAFKAERLATILAIIDRNFATVIYAVHFVPPSRIAVRAPPECAGCC